MNIEWFIYHKNSILGPLSSEEVNHQILNETIDENAFVWWKGEGDWIPVRKWEQNYDSIVKNLTLHFESLWRIKTKTETTDFMSFESAVEYLRELDLKKNIFLHREDSPEWQSLYANAIFLNSLEMSRRKHPRVPIVATAKVAKPNSKFSYFVKVNIIGKGGMGMYGLGKNFTQGSVIDIFLDSSHLSTPLKLQGVIKYHTGAGVCGIEFQDVDTDSEKVICEYIENFLSQTGQIHKKAA